jgi:hypothetical protein
MGIRNRHREEDNMTKGKRHITTTRVVFAIFWVGVIIAGSIIGYTHYRANRWVIVKESPDAWVEINDELAQPNSAPCPEMKLKHGGVKFLRSTTDKGQVLLGYKLTVGSEMGKQEKDPKKYAPFTYQTRFSFTLLDKDGFPLQVIEGPTGYEIFEISKTRTYQSVCPNPIETNIAKHSQEVYVTYILSATGPRPR